MALLAQPDASQFAADIGVAVPLRGGGDGAACGGITRSVGVPPLFMDDGGGSQIMLLEQVSLGLLLSSEYFSNFE